jgi:hypothetical protein
VIFGVERGDVNRWPGNPTLVGLVGFRDFYEPPVEELLFALHRIERAEWESGPGRRVREGI